MWSVNVVLRYFCSKCQPYSHPSDFLLPSFPHDHHLPTPKPIPSPPSNHPDPFLNPLIYSPSCPDLKIESPTHQHQLTDHFFIVERPPLTALILNPILLSVLELVEYDQDITFRKGTDIALEDVEEGGEEARANAEEDKGLKDLVGNEAGLARANAEEECGTGGGLEEDGAGEG